jgi:hypothetical protein
MTSQTQLLTLDADLLVTATGGTPAARPAAAPANQPANQQELRDLASRYCPATYRQFQSTPTLTRAMGEQCLDEAGLGMFKGRLDRYFPRTQGR